MEAVKTVLFLVTIALGLATAGLVAVGGADGTWQHEGMHRIPHRPEEVYEWISEPEHRPKWIEGLRSCEEPLAGVEEGAALKEELLIDGKRVKRTVEITEAVYSRRFAYRTTVDDVDYEVVYETSPHNTGKKCVVRFTCTVQYHGWWRRLMEPVLASPIRESLYADLERLEAEMAAAGY